MTTETLMTDGETTQVADAQQTATSQTEGQPAAGSEQATQQQQATEGQTTEGQKPEGEQTGSEAAKPEGAPVKYEFKAPEGHQLDESVVGVFSEVARELNLPQDKAQMVLDKMAPVIAARQAEQLDAAVTEWATTSKGDKEFGGAQLNENLALAQKALNTFGTPELRTLLNQSGLGNHPEVIRAFYRAGKAISEDKFVGGKSAPTSGKDTASVLYPNQK